MLSFLSAAFGFEAVLLSLLSIFLGLVDFLSHVLRHDVCAALRFNRTLLGISRVPFSLSLLSFSSGGPLLSLRLRSFSSSSALLGVRDAALRSCKAFLRLSQQAFCRRRALLGCRDSGSRFSRRDLSIQNGALGGEGTLLADCSTRIDVDKVLLQ